jgi:protoporphyrinogen oxidase
MRIAIIGAGFTGLAAGFKLAKRGHDVTIFESNQIPGGLAIGFSNKKWKWDMEAHYHHLFKTDYAIQKLAKEVDYKINFIRPKTSTYYRNSINQIDSPINLLKFKHLSLQDRFRTGFILGYLKLTNSWQNLEKVTTKEFLIKTMGRKSWEVLWEPLMVKKFGEYANKIPASWFWARVKSRTASLGYPEAGFKRFAKRISDRIEREGGTFFYGTGVDQIKRNKNGFVLTAHNNEYTFDKVICTLPNYLFTKITKNLPKQYINSLNSFEGIGATNLVLVLKNSFLNDGTYWLNINEKRFPFLCIVEHTNFIDSKKYNGEKIIYVGNYLKKNHRYFKYSEKEILNEYYSFLKIINPKFNKKWIKKSYFFKAQFAQPIITKDYSKKITSVKTPIAGLYLANIQQVYPWDRGTNYAVQLGEKAADILIKDA